MQLVLDEWSIRGAFWGLASAFLVSLILALPIYRLLLHLKSRQTVSEFVPEHSGKQGTPTMGGIIVVVGMAGAFWSQLSMPKAFPILFQRVGAQPPSEPNFSAFILLLAGFAVIGFVDDFVVPRMMKGKRGLGWLPKLAMQFLVAIPACWMSGASSWLGAFGLAFFVVAFSNAYNFSDGMDGLAGGLAVILALGIGTVGVAMHAPHWHLGLCLGVVGAMFPFLFLNAPPARVFMGDVGSLPIGACLGWLALQSMGRSTAFPESVYAWYTAIALLGGVMLAELLPVPMQIAWVKLFKRRLFPMTPIHHAFQKAGWPETRVVALFHLVQAVLAFSAIYLVLSWPIAGGR